MNDQQLFDSMGNPLIQTRTVEVKRRAIIVELSCESIDHLKSTLRMIQSGSFFLGHCDRVIAPTEEIAAELDGRTEARVVSAAQAEASRLNGYEAAQG